MKLPTRALCIFAVVLAASFILVHFARDTHRDPIANPLAPASAPLDSMPSVAEHEADRSETLSGATPPQLHIQVLLADDAAPRLPLEVRLTAIDSGLEQVEQTDAEGSVYFLALPPNHYQVTVTGDVNRPATEVPMVERELHLTTTEPTYLQLHLPVVELAFSGRVTLAQRSNDNSDTTLGTTPLGHTPLALTSQRQAEYTTTWTTTDATGAFRAAFYEDPPIPNGETPTAHTLIVLASEPSSGALLSSQSVSLSLPLRSTQHDLGTLQFAPSAATIDDVITGVVLDPQGVPVPGVKIFTSTDASVDRGGGQSGGQGADRSNDAANADPLVTRTDGGFFFAPQQEDDGRGEAAESFYFTVESNGFWRETFGPFAAGESLTLQLKPPQALSGSIICDSAFPHDAVFVALHEESPRLVQGITRYPELDSSDLHQVSPQGKFSFTTGDRRKEILYLYLQVGTEFIPIVSQPLREDFLAVPVAANGHSRAIQLKPIDLRGEFVEAHLRATDVNGLPLADTEWRSDAQTGSALHASATACFARGTEFRGWLPQGSMLEICCDGYRDAWVTIEDSTSELVAVELRVAPTLVFVAEEIPPLLAGQELICSLELNGRSRGIVSLANAESGRITTDTPIPRRGNYRIRVGIATLPATPDSAEENTTENANPEGASRLHWSPSPWDSPSSLQVQDLSTLPHTFSVALPIFISLL